MDNIKDKDYILKGYESDYEPELLFLRKDRPKFIIELDIIVRNSNFHVQPSGEIKFNVVQTHDKCTPSRKF